MPAITDDQIRRSILAGQGVPESENNNKVLELTTTTKGSSRSPTRSRSPKRQQQRSVSPKRPHPPNSLDKRLDIMLADTREWEDSDHSESVYVVNEMNEMMIREKELAAEQRPSSKVWTIICIGLLFAIVLVGTVQFFEFAVAGTFQFFEYLGGGSNNDNNYAEQLGLPFSIPHATYEAIKDEESPQSAAYKWLKADPQFSNYSSQQLQQRMALAIFYYSTDGQEWTKKGGVSPTNISVTFKPWLSYNQSECSWYSFSEMEEAQSVACDEEGNMLHLVLIEKNLQGTLPDELSWLSSLQTLDLNGNYIGGTVPTILGSMPNLVKLSLYHNKFAGGVPSELGQLAPSLKWLNLRENFFNGTLPSHIWKLSQLELLNLGDNDQLIGSFPEDLGTLMPNLVELKTLKSSQWTGPLPTSIGSMTALKQLHLHHNQLTGTIPPLPNSLVAFHAPRNQFSGNLPHQLPFHLQHLDLGGNKQLEGTIPSTWNRTALVELKLWGTSITGIVPKQVCGTAILEFDCGAELCGCDCACEDFAG